MSDGRVPTAPGYSAEPEPVCAVSALSGEYPSRKTAAMAVRFTPAVKAEIEAAAKANGRSIAREVEFRLVESLLRDRFGDIDERVKRLERAVFPLDYPPPPPPFGPIRNAVAGQVTKIIFSHNSDIAE